MNGQYGERDYYAVHGWAGGDTRYVGGLVETWQQGSDGFKTIDGLPGADTGFQREDYLAKLAVHSDPSAATEARLEFKYGNADTEANETYLGLADADFEADPFRRYAASQNDVFRSQHEQYQLTGLVRTADDTLLTLAAYWNDFARNWSKLQSIDFGDGRGQTSPQRVFQNPGHAENQDALAILRGADSEEGAVRIRNNNRVYDSRGVQLGLVKPFVTGPAAHTVELSVRYHEDEEDRLQNEEFYTQTDGRLIFDREGGPGSQANREAKAEAIAFYIEDRIEFGPLTVIPGLRYEGIELTRLDYSRSDPDRRRSRPAYAKPV